MNYLVAYKDGTEPHTTILDFDDADKVTRTLLSRITKKLESEFPRSDILLLAVTSFSEDEQAVSCWDYKREMFTGRALPIGSTIFDDATIGTPCAQCGKPINDKIYRSMEIGSNPAHPYAVCRNCILEELERRYI